MSNKSTRSSISGIASTTSKVPSLAVPSSASKGEREADARKAFLHSLNAAAAESNGEVLSRVNIIHAQAPMIEKQTKGLEQETKKLKKQNDEMEQWLNKSANKIKEVNKMLQREVNGDLENDLDDMDTFLDQFEAGQSKTTTST